MLIKADLLILILVASISFTLQSPCKIAVHCPCESKDSNITSICVEEMIADERCSTWPGCMVCTKGQECLKCPGDFPCTEATTHKGKLRQKRQYSTRQRYPARQGSSCPDMEPPEAGNVRCLNSATQRSCTGRCIPGYLFENRESESEIYLTCQNGVWAPFRRFPECKSSGQCELEVIETGRFNCTADNTGTRCDVYCYNRYTGQFRCYPGRGWNPPLPRCVVQKDSSRSTGSSGESPQPCRCEYGGRCDGNDRCICPVGRTGVRCESIVSERAGCNDPGFISNGYRRNMDGTESDRRANRRFQDGESVVFSCMSQEFALQGYSVLTCYDGSWSSSTPRCIQTTGITAPSVVMCPDPGQVPNADRFNADDGTISQVSQQYRVGQSVAYTCREGFALQDRSLITCTSSREWSYRLPSCTRIDGRRPVSSPGGVADIPVRCPYPGDITNGRVVYTNIPNGSVGRINPRTDYPREAGLMYSCNGGFTLEGENYLTCQANGGWSAEPPTCKDTGDEIDERCRNPGSVLNGRLSNTRVPGGGSGMDPDFPQGTRLEYSCEEGYSLEGTRALTCQANGAWSSDLPDCIYNTGDDTVERCMNPGTVSNGRLSITGVPDGDSGMDANFPRGTRLEYSCEEGYSLEGTRALTCQANGDWSSDPPDCSYRSPNIAYCANPGPIPNGMISYFPPFNRRTSGSAQRILEVPEFPQGGRLEYSCEDGYGLDGEELLSCESSGMWSANPPVCTPREENGPMRFCSDPGPISNGRTSYLPAPSESRRGPMPVPDEEEFPQGATLQYACDNGFTRDGVESLTCGSEGFWSGIPPECNRVTGRTFMYCNNLGSIPNGRVTQIPPSSGPGPRPGAANDPLEYPEGTILRYSCENGYDLDGPSELTCQPTSFWSDDPPTCITECGRSSATAARRITNGIQTQAGDWPWVVAIAVDENGFTNIVCGGAVWTSGVVVTAAHCLTDASTFTLYFGKLYRRNNRDDADVQTRTSTRVIFHPFFNSTTYDFDLGLIMFEPRITFSNRISPICEPTAETNARNLMTGKDGYVTGWGENERGLEADSLLLAILPYQSDEACMEAYRSQTLNLPLTRNMFCAGFEDGQQSACTGDSGSALVFYNSRTMRYNIEGIVSYGVEGQCGQPRRYTVFTRVFPLLPWIISNVT